MAKRKGTNNDLQNTMRKTRDRVTRTQLKTRGDLMCSGMVSSSCSISDTCRVALVTKQVISHEVLTKRGTNRWSFVTQIFRKG